MFYKEQEVIQKTYAHKEHMMSVKASVLHASQAFTAKS